MRVLLLGGTGFLGRRCIQALLAHKHTLILYVRNPAKLQTLVSAEVLAAVEAVVVGDATDAIQIAQAIREHKIEAVVNTAGNQVEPWKEPLLPKIAKAVCDAAVAIGKERGWPLRIWLVAGVNILAYPGTGGLIHDYVPIPGASAAHMGVRDVVQAHPLSDLRWSLICVAQMVPSNPGFAPFTLGPRKPSAEGVVTFLDAPRGHNLLLKATTPPAWENTWLVRIPWIGMFLNGLVVLLTQYETKYEEVADLLAADLASGSEEWVGMKVGMKDKGKVKNV